MQGFPVNSGVSPQFLQPFPIDNVWLIRIWTIHKLSLWLYWQILISYCKFLMPRPLKWSIPGAHIIMISKIFMKSQRQIMWGSNFYESDVSADFPCRDPEISIPCSFYGQSICIVGSIWQVWSNFKWAHEWSGDPKWTLVSYGPFLLTS